MMLRRISASLYHALVMARHPDAIRLRLRGIDYEHYRNLRQSWLLGMNIRSILDVGANVGQFALLAREVFPAARIFSFEPLPECFASLESCLPPQGFQAFNFALGDSDTELDFHRARHSPSSSFLKMNDFHREAFPESREGQESTSVKVKVRKLDDIAKELDLKENILLKLDVQGYEDKVIAGGGETLKRVRVVISETSFLPLYEGQTLFRDVHGFLEKAGFVFQGNLNQMFNPSDGRIVSADSIFVRPNSRAT
jgi:FkbM family methyltransferase